MYSFIIALLFYKLSLYYLYFYYNPLRLFSNHIEFYVLTSSRVTGFSGQKSK